MIETEDDPLAGYHPGWRKAGPKKVPQASGDVDLREEDPQQELTIDHSKQRGSDDPLADYTPDWKKEKPIAMKPVVVSKSDMERLPPVVVSKPPDETTILSPKDEDAFQRWAKTNKITDVDHPDSHYDYRGYWREMGGKPVKFGVDHFPDTYKQHGHPTFSVESKYSEGDGDGGTWEGNTFVPAKEKLPSLPPVVVSKPDEPLTEEDDKTYRASLDRAHAHAPNRPLDIGERAAQLTGGTPTVVRSRSSAHPASAGEYIPPTVASKGDTLFLGADESAPADFVHAHEWAHRLFSVNDPDGNDATRPEGNRDPHVATIIANMRKRGGAAPTEEFASAFAEAMRAAYGSGKFGADSTTAHRANPEDVAAIEGWIRSKDDQLPRPKPIAPPVMAPRDATRLPRATSSAPPAAPSSETPLPKPLREAIEVAKQSPQVEAPVEAAKMVAAPVTSALTVGRYLGQQVTNDPEGDADASRSLGIEPVGDKEALVAGAQVGTMAAAPLVGKLVGRAALAALEGMGAPSVVARGIAGTAAAAAEGAPIGASYDPEHPARGALIGGGLGVLSNEVGAAGARAARPLQSAEPVAETNPDRLLANPRRPSATARVVDAPTPSAQPDYSVEDMPGEPPTRIEQIRQARAAALKTQAPEAAPTNPNAPLSTTPPEHLAVRVGPIGKDGAYFSRTAEIDPKTPPYDLRNVKLANGGDPATVQQVLGETLKDPSLTPEQQARVQQLAQAGRIDFQSNDELPIPAAAKRLGYDGIQVFEADDTKLPSSAFIWNIRKVQPGVVSKAAPAPAVAKPAWGTGPIDPQPELADVERALGALKGAQARATDPDMQGELGSRISMLEAQRRKLRGEPEPEVATAAASRAAKAAGVRSIDEIPTTAEKPTAPEKKKYDYSSTQLDLPPETAAKIHALSAKIPDEHLAENGREDEPHITVKYGLHGNDPEKVRALLADDPPITVTLGKTSHFPDAGSGDVVKVDVDSPQLHALNKKIADALPHTDTHPEYKPHATVAYVKKGMGKKYSGDASLDGHTITLDRLTFSGKDGNKVEIPLGGEPAPASDDVAASSAPAPAKKVRAKKPKPDRYAHVPTGDLLETLAMEQHKLDEAGMKVHAAHFVRVPEDGSPPISGAGLGGGIWRQQAKFTAARIAQIEAQLRKAGIHDDDIQAARFDTEHAAEMAAAVRTREGGENDQLTSDATDFDFGPGSEDALASFPRPSQTTDHGASTKPHDGGSEAVARGGGLAADESDLGPAGRRPFATAGDAARGDASEAAGSRAADLGQHDEAGAPGGVDRDLFGNAPVRSAADQGGLFGEKAGTEAARPLAGAERAAQNEIDRLTPVAKGGTREARMAARARIAEIEKLVNRGEKIGTGKSDLPDDSELDDAAEPGGSLFSPSGPPRNQYVDAVAGWWERQTPAERKKFILRGNEVYPANPMSVALADVPYERLPTHLQERIGIGYVQSRAPAIPRPASRQKPKAGAGNEGLHQSLDEISAGVGQMGQHLEELAAQITQERAAAERGERKASLKVERGAAGSGGSVTETPAFRRWFGNSKVVDADGKPLVVYHGTKSDITEFQPSRGGEYGSGIYLTNDAGAAWAYAERAHGDGGENVMPVYVRIAKPYIATAGTRDYVRARGVKKLKAEGYDGIIATGLTGEKQYIAFSSEQIKSATGNRGTFDPRNANILFSPAAPGTPLGAQIAAAQGQPTTGPAAARAAQNVKSLADIARTLGRLVDVPVRQGRFNAAAMRARGVFFLDKEVTRVLRYDHLDTVAHEIGHFISKKYLRNPTMGGAGARGAAPLSIAAKRELVKMGKDLYGARKPNGGYGEEGIAQWARFYVMDPARLAADAPTFSAWIDSNVLAKEPALKDALDQAQGDFKDYAAAPATARVDAMIDVNAAHRFLPDSRTLATAMLDDLNEIRLAVEDIGRTTSPAKNAYLLARLSRGGAGMAEEMIERGVIDPDTGKRVTKGIAEILGELKKSDVQAFRRYLVAERTLEVAKRGVNAGITVADAQDVVTKYEKQFKPLAEEVWKISNALIDYRQAKGLLTAGEAKTIKENNQRRVGFYRVFDESETAGRAGSGKGFGRNSSGLQKMKGSARPIIDPLESIITDVYRTVQQSHAAEVLSALVKHADSTPGAGRVIEVLTEAPKRRIELPLEMVKQQLADLGFDDSNVDPADMDGVLAGFQKVSQAGPGETKDLVRPLVIDGQRKWIQIADAPLYNALAGLGTPQMPQWLRLMSIPTRTLRAGATLTAEFIARNPVKDAFTAAIYSRAGARPPGWDFAKGLFHVLKADHIYQDWRLDGGDNAAMLGLDRVDIRAHVKTLMRSKGREAVDWVLRPIDTLRMLSSLTENATRVGEYAGVREQLEKRGMAEKDARTGATMASRDVTIDFAKAGDVGRQVNALIAFFNANVQGWEKLVREFKQRPETVIPRLLAWITLPSLALWYLQKDDPAYQEVPAWQKMAAWVIVQHHADGSVAHIWRIPKPPELGVLFGSAPERIADWIYRKDPRALDGVANSFQSFNPLHLPEVLAPMVEWWANKNTFTGRPIVPDGLSKLPAGEQATSRTGELMRTLGGATNLSPANLENTVKGYTGGLGSYGLDIGDAITRGVRSAAGAPPLPNAAHGRGELGPRLPLARGFMVRVPQLDAQSVQDVMDKFGEAEGERQAWRRKLEAGDREGAHAYFKAHEAEIRSVGTKTDGFMRPGPLRAAQELIVDAQRVSRDADDDTREEIADVTIRAARAVLNGDHISRIDLLRMKRAAARIEKQGHRQILRARGDLRP